MKRGLNEMVRREERGGLTLIACEKARESNDHTRSIVLGRSRKKL